MMNHLARAVWRTLASGTLWGLISACVPDVVEPNGFVRGEGGKGSEGGEGGEDAGSARQDSASGPRGPDAPPGPSGRGDPPPTEDPRPPGRALDPDCDLNGRWLIAQRVLATAVGQEQAAFSWFYYQIHQEGAALTVQKGLHCGFEVVKKTSLAASVDSSGAWPALLERLRSTGRKGRFVKEDAGCRLHLEKEYVVRGASLPHYLDPTRPLPDRSQPATGDAPGWEDWDGDGQPGLSYRVRSSLANGTLYVCQREWTEYDGTTAAGASKLRVAITTGVEQVALGRSPGAPQAIETSARPASDPEQHYAFFHRLDDTQATGSDAEICAAIRALKDTLVPEAGQ